MSARKAPQIFTKKVLNAEYSWPQLNDLVRHASEADCLKLLEIEKATHRRETYLLRIHSRLQRVRSARERRELIVMAKTRIH